MDGMQGYRKFWNQLSKVIGYRQLSKQRAGYAQGSGIMFMPYALNSFVSAEFAPVSCSSDYSSQK